MRHPFAFWSVAAAFLAVVLIFLKSTSLKSQAYQLERRKQAEIVSLLESDHRKVTPIDVPILVYHYVEHVTDTRDTIRQSLNISPEIFESQLVTLLTSGYHPISLTTLMSYFKNDGVLPENPVLITFDDGYRDFYTNVVPVIKRFSIPVVLYMVSGFLDSTNNYLTTAQLHEINDLGLVEIGAHSETHTNFRDLTLIEIRQEIRQSKTALEKIIGKKVLHFAYPFGSYTSSISSEVRRAGYDTSATMDKGVIQSYKDRFQLKRVRPGRLTGQLLLGLLK